MLIAALIPLQSIAADDEGWEKKSLYEAVGVLKYKHIGDCYVKMYIGGYKLKLDHETKEKFSKFTLRSSGKEIFEEGGVYTVYGYGDADWYATLLDGSKSVGRIDISQPKMEVVKESLLAVKIEVNFDREYEVLVPIKNISIGDKDQKSMLDENFQAVIPCWVSWRSSNWRRVYMFIKTPDGNEVSGDEGFEIEFSPIDCLYSRDSRYTSIEVGLYNGFENKVKTDDLLGALKKISVSEYIYGKVPEWKSISGDKTVIFGNLKANESNSFEVLLEYDNGQATICDILFTKSFSADYKRVHLGPTSVIYEIDLPEDEIEGGNFSGYWKIGNKMIEEPIWSKTNLEPEQTVKDIYCIVKYYDKDGYYNTEAESEKFSITTPKLEWKEGMSEALTKTKARIINETNCDATTGTSIEWRRVDAPDVVKSNTAQCPIVDGKLVGVLENLNPDVYYKYRPLFTSASGKKYYGQWVGIFTGDAGVVFKPEVRTGQSRALSENAVSLSGSVLPGSEDITEQGFEWWLTDSPSRASGAGQTYGLIKSDGICMEAELTELLFSTSYTYRAYAKTEKETYYGAEQTFTTEAYSGITDVCAGVNGRLSVKLRENPVRSKAVVKIVGSTAETARLIVTSLSGAVVAQTEVPADGEWQDLELNLAGGFYLLTAVTPEGSKDTIRMIVR